MFTESDYEIKLNQESEFRDLARIAQVDQLLNELHPRQRQNKHTTHMMLVGIGHFLLGMFTFLNISPRH